MTALNFSKLSNFYQNVLTKNTNGCIVNTNLIHLTKALIRNSRLYWIYREALAGVKGYEGKVEHIFELFTEQGTDLQ